MTEQKETADSWLTNWESSTVDEWLRKQEDFDKLRTPDDELNEQKLWCLFQSSASNIASMYKGKIYIYTYIRRRRYLKWKIVDKLKT